MILDIYVKFSNSGLDLRKRKQGNTFTKHCENKVMSKVLVYSKSNNGEVLAEKNYCVDMKN